MNELNEDHRVTSRPQ